MFRLYVKKQLRFSMLCAVVICIALCIWNYIQHTAKLIYSFDFDKLNLTEQTEEALLMELDERNQEVQERYAGIDLFETYEGERPKLQMISEDGSVEETLLLDREMISWWNREMKEQAIYSDFLGKDQLLMRDVTEMVQYQLQVAYVAEQNKASYARNINRYANQPYRKAIYERMYGWAEQICIDFEVQNLSGITTFADYISRDCTPLILILFSCFFGMEEFVHGNEGRQVLVSRRSLRFYTWKMMGVNLLAALLEALLFLGISYLIWGKFVFHADVLKLPVQALTDYDTVVFPVSVGEYLLICLGCHSLVYLTLGGVIQVISLLSPNSTISFGVSLIVTFGTGQFLLSGLMDNLMTGRPFLQVGNYPLDHYAIFVGGCIVVLFLSFVLVGVLTKLRIQSWHER